MTMTTVLPMASRSPTSASSTIRSFSVVELAGRFVGEDQRGRRAAAAAMATRCCSPPDSAPGRWAARCESPTWRQRLAGRRADVACRGRAEGRARRSRARSARCHRLSFWKTSPISARYSASSSSLSRSSGRPNTRTSPADGESRPATRWRNVLLPEPEGPNTATTSAPFDRHGSARAAQRSRSSPDEKIRNRSSSCTHGRPPRASGSGSTYRLRTRLTSMRSS